MVEIWGWITTPWFAIIDLPYSILSLFSSWDLVFPGPLQQKPRLNFSWLTLPKFIIWEIWLERNTFLKELHKALPKNKIPLNPKESNWL